MRYLSMFSVAIMLAMAMPYADCAEGVPGKSDATVTKSAYNHDMSAYRTRAEAIVLVVKEGKMETANDLIHQLETTWDKGTSDFKWGDFDIYKPIDIQLDAAIDACDTKDSLKALAELMKFLDMLSKVPKQ